MEPQTCFDLNTAIENWRVELAAQTNLTADDWRELETHLRDAITGFQQHGLNDEESFWLARKRAGQPSQLGEEFAKADPAKVWGERIFWMCLAVFLSSTLGGLVFSVDLAFMNDHINHSRLFVTIKTFSYLMASLVPLIIAVFLAKGRFLTIISRMTSLVENRMRLAVSIVFCIALSASARIIGLCFLESGNRGVFGFPLGNNPHIFYQNSILKGLAETIYPLIIGLLLIWLKSIQDRRTLKRA